MTGLGVAAVAAGRSSGRLAASLGRRTVFTVGLLSAAAADLVLFVFGTSILGVLAGVVLLGLGFILAHSTFLTIATEFAARARGTAMSLVAFCFMGGGGLGTALAGALIKAAGFQFLFGSYGLALAGLAVIAPVLVRQTASAPATMASAMASDDTLR